LVSDDGFVTLASAADTPPPHISVRIAAMEWQVYVPIIVGIFVLLGVILAAIPRTRRRPTQRPSDTNRPPTREDAARPGGVIAPANFGHVLETALDRQHIRHARLEGA